MEDRHTEEDSLHPFKPRPAGRVFKLQPDWSALINLLPKLNSSATVFRCSGSILCQHRAFSEMSQYDELAFHTEGFRGLSLRTDYWSEAWWYHEEREGQMCPCLEIANELGQGLLKLCYRLPEDAFGDMPLIEQFVHTEGDAWDILHLQRGNVMNCSSATCDSKKTKIRNALASIFQEAYENSAQLGVLLCRDEQSMWDSLHPSRPGTTCCWLTIGSNGSFLNVEPGGFSGVQVHRRGKRLVVVFNDQDNSPSLTLLEPDGIKLQSLRSLQSCQF